MTGKDTKTASVVSSALLAILNVYWAVSTFAGVEETFSVFDLIAFSSTAVCATILEIPIIFLLVKFGHSLSRIWLVTAAFITINAYCLNLVFVDSYMNLKLMKYLALAIGFFIAFTTVRMVCESKGLRVFVFAAILILLGLVFLPTYLWTGDGKQEATLQKENGNMTASSKIRNVKFLTKPNVYFIGFESAAPAAILEKYLSLKNAPLPESFKENGFRVFKNTFSEGRITRPSFNLMLSMDSDYFKSINDRIKDHLFQGITPSPLFQIFKANGYETSTLYQNSYFGKNKGKHIDHYLFNQEFSVCDFMRKRTKRHAFFGACRLRESSVFPKNFKIDGPPIDFLMSYLRSISTRKKPQFLLVHLTPPIHTDSHGEYHGTKKEIAEFRIEYENASKEAAKNLKRIKEFIESNDPNSIIFAFGDHGVWLSRKINFEDDPTYHVQDKFAVVAGIFPPDACSGSLNAPFSDGYLTTNEISRLIIRCLAGGADPFIGPYTHQAFDHPRMINLKDYIYE